MRRHATVIVAALGMLACGAGELQILHIVNQRHIDRVTQETETATHKRNAVLNRAVNVETWCEGINAINDYDRVIVRRAAHGLIVYTLPNLDCERIIKATLQSGFRKPHITVRGTPLVYRALHSK